MTEEAMSTLYQISNSSALVEGVYSGSVCSSVFLEQGDFGLGTFEDLDCEIYQVAERVRPFASITHFLAKSSLEIDKVACLKGIELACDQQRISDNLFYALRFGWHF